jgi:gluconate 2-dehydrogenase gamma chain
MNDRLREARLSRRSLLASTAALLVAGATSARARTITGMLPWEQGTAAPPVPVRPGPWQFFTADEAATVEAIVDRLIPPDDHGPGAKDAGCAVYLDRQLAGPFGRSEGLYMRPPFLKALPTQGYQDADAPAARYRKGLAAIAAYVKDNFAGKAFQNLAPADQDKVLTDVEKGTAKLGDVNGASFFSLLLSGTQEGFFADPIYGGNRDMVGWKLVGFPGARYDYRDWIERYNEKYPLPPVSIMGRSDWTVKD